MRGTVRKISLPRRLVVDLMHASIRVPFVSLTRAAQHPSPAGGPRAGRAAARLGRDLRQGVRAGGPGRAGAAHALRQMAVAAASTNCRAASRWWRSRASRTARIACCRRRLPAPDSLPLAEIDALIRHAKEAPIDEVPMFRKILRATRLPLPLRRLIWSIGLNFGRQRANYFGSFGVTSVAAYGAGELHALSPGPYILSYGVVRPDQTIDVVIRWDHRITDAALIAKALTRLEQVLNTEIAAELRASRQQTEPKAGPGGRDLTAWPIFRDIRRTGPK